MYNKGFTLIEIMVVVVILGILAAIVVPNLTQNVDTASLTKLKADIKEMVSQLELYKLDNFDYPATEQGLDALVTKPVGSPEPPNWRQYLPRLPKDPWGRDYLYLYPGEHGIYDVYTLGKDGQIGGENLDADYGNWSE